MKKILLSLLLLATTACSMLHADPNEIKLTASEKATFASFKTRGRDLANKADELQIAKDQLCVDEKQFVENVRKAHDLGPDDYLNVNVEQQTFVKQSKFVTEAH